MLVGWCAPRRGAVVAVAAVSLGLVPLGLFGQDAQATTPGGSRSNSPSRDKAAGGKKSLSPSRSAGQQAGPETGTGDAGGAADSAELREVIAALNGVKIKDAETKIKIEGWREERITDVHGKTRTLRAGGTPNLHPFEPIDRVFDLHPQIKTLPPPLTSSTAVVTEMFAGGDGSTVTMGALVDGLPIPGTEAHGRVPQVLTVTNDTKIIEENGAGKPVTVVTVTRPKLAGEAADAPPTTFRFTSPWDKPTGWERVFPEVRARNRLTAPRLQYFHPQAVTRGNRPFPGGFSFGGFSFDSFNNYKMLMVRDRQIRGDADGAINAFTDLGLHGRANGLRSLQRYFPGSKVQETSLKKLKAQLLEKTDPTAVVPQVHGILTADRPYTVVTHRGQMLLYLNELSGRAVPVDKVAKELATRGTDTVTFLSTDGQAVIPAHPQPRLGEHPQGRWTWHPALTHEDAFTKAAEALQPTGTLQPREKIQIQGTLVRDVPYENTDGSRTYAALGQPQARGTRVQWTIEPLPTQPPAAQPPATQPRSRRLLTRLFHRRHDSSRPGTAAAPQPPPAEPQVRITTKWNLTDYVNSASSEWTEAGTKVIPLSQLTAEGRTYPTGNTYIRISGNAYG